MRPRLPCWSIIGLALLSAAFATAAPARVQDQAAADAFGRLIVEKDAALERQDLVAAEQALMQLQALARRHIDPDEFIVGQIEIGLADVLQAQGRGDESIPHYRAGLEIYRAANAAPLEIQYPAHVLSILLSDRAQFDEAEALMREAADIRLSQFGPDHFETAVGLRDLGAVIFRSGRYDEAEDYVEQSVRILRAQTSPDPALMAVTLVQLSHIQQAQGRQAAAEATIREALAGFAQAGLTQDLERAAALGALGVTLRGQGRFRESEDALREALAIYRALQGDDHANVAYALLNLGAVIHYQARLLLPAVLESWTVETADAPEHAEAMARLATAETLYRQALDINRRTLGGDHPNVGATLGGVAAILQDRGRHAEAEAIQREAADLYRRTFGARHLDTAFGLHNLANIVRRRSAAEAVPLYREVLDIRRALLSAPNLEIAESLNNLGVMLLLTGRNDEARRLLNEAFAMKAAIWCPDGMGAIPADDQTADCPGHPSFAGTVVGDATARFVIEDRPWAGLRLMSQAEDMTLRRTRLRYTLDPDARAEFRRYGYVHRQFVTVAWAAGYPDDSAAIKTDLRDYYWPSLAGSD